MPTEREIVAAGPLRRDDPAVQAALKKVSTGVVHALLRLEEYAGRAVPEQQPEDPPPKDRKGAGSPTSSPQPSEPTSTNTTAGDQTERRRLCLPPW